MHQATFDICPVPSHGYTSLSDIFPLCRAHISTCADFLDPDFTTTTTAVLSPPAIASMAQYSNKDMDRSFLDADVTEIVSKLKADERALLLAGVNWWNTLAIPRLNVPGVRMSDGPNVRLLPFFAHC